MILIILGIMFLYVLGGTFTLGVIRQVKQSTDIDNFWGFVLWPVPLIVCLVSGLVIHSLPLVNCLYGIFGSYLVIFFKLIYELGDLLGTFLLKERKR